MQSNVRPQPSLPLQPTKLARLASPLHSVNVGDVTSRLETFRNIQVGLIVWQLADAHDVRSFRLVDFNRAAERELGTPIGDRVGEAIADIYPAILKTNLPERYRQIIVSGKPATLGEVRYGDRSVPESVFWLDCFPLPHNCVGVAFENITGRKKREQTEAQSLGLLHRITRAINGSTVSSDAAQVCVNEVCKQIGWPVGRLFLTDEHSATRFVPNPIWYFSDAHRFEGFRHATEMFELDLTNKFVLEHRVQQGKKAGLTRSVGFSVLEGNTLKAVLEFSSETAAPLDETLAGVISDIGVQLGRVFEREGAAMNMQLMYRQDEERRDATKKLRACTSRYGSLLKASLQRLSSRTLTGGMAPARQVASSIRLMERCFAEMREIGSPPIEFGPSHGPR